MKKLVIGALFAAAVGLTPHQASAMRVAPPGALAVDAAAPDAEPVHWRRYRHCHRRAGVCHGGRYYRRYYRGYYGWRRPYWGGPGFYFGFGPWGPAFRFW